MSTGAKFYQVIGLSFIIQRVKLIFVNYFSANQNKVFWILDESMMCYVHFEFQCASISFKVVYIYHVYSLKNWVYCMNPC